MSTELIGYFLTKVTSLEAENVALRARITDLETPDMFWNDDELGSPQSGDTLEAMVVELLGRADNPLREKEYRVVSVAAARKCQDVNLVAHRAGGQYVCDQYLTERDAKSAYYKASNAAYVAELRATQKESDHA